MTLHQDPGPRTRCLCLRLDYCTNCPHVVVTLGEYVASLSVRCRKVMDGPIEAPYFKEVELLVYGSRDKLVPIPGWCPLPHLKLKDV